uniref:L-Fucosyltransferase n=1 Tax=Panagrolaimus sp. PS1159 TaxID=55785 RepID=A0AC35EZ86_9BILA
MTQSNNRLVIGVLALGTLIFILFCMSKSSDRDRIKAQVSSRDFYESLRPQCPIIQCPTPDLSLFNDSEKVAAVSTVLQQQKQQQQIKKCKNETTKTLLERAYERKYIGCNFYATGGIGNQIWRFASLYGLGRFTGRNPYFEARNPEQMNNLMEIALTFPMMHEVLQVKNPPDNFVKKFHFADDCCKFDDPRKLLDWPDKYIKVYGDYMQSYKFFHPYRDEIRQIFDCGLTIKMSLNAFTEELFQADTSFKLCAHVRRGDFLTDIMLESKEDFTVPAINYAYQYLINKGHENISMLFIGNDLPFVKNLPIQNVGFQHIYTPESRIRGEDMCLGINYCDAMIMTASGSTFGWWISYLMKPNSTIFYNAQITDNADFTKDIHDFDIFPKEWIMLSLKDGKAVKETQWWHQRRGLPPDLPPKGMQPWI